MRGISGTGASKRTRAEPLVGSISSKSPLPEVPAISFPSFDQASAVTCVSSAV